MKKFMVEVRRTAWATRTIEVEAENVGKAKEKAIDMAGDFEFSEKDAEYEATWVSSPMPEKKN